MVPRTLDQLLGNTGLSKFGTLDENVFVKQLDDIALSKTDFQDFAAEHGIRVLDDIERAKEKLLSMFRSYIAEYKQIDQKTQPALKKRKGLAEIMKEGR